jgi:hypothetical protein
MTKLTKRAIWKILFWLVSEIILNLSGLDDLADYSEFVFEKSAIGSDHIRVEIVA